MYSLIKKKFGTSKFDNICNIETDLAINDVVYMGKSDYLLTLPVHHCIAWLSNNKLTLPWLGELNQVGDKNGDQDSALMNAPLRIGAGSAFCYVVEDNGKTLRTLDVANRYVSGFFGNVSKKKMHSLCGHLTSFSGSIDVVGKDVYVAYGPLNRVLRFNGSDVFEFIGSGKGGYSVASKMEYSSLSNPTGISCDKGNIYISDTGNHCIRRFSDNILTVVAGHPLKAGDVGGNKALLNSPGKIRIRNDVGYFIDGNKIKSFSSSGILTAYESDKIVSFDIDYEKNLLIVEKI